MFLYIPQVGVKGPYTKSQLYDLQEAGGITSNTKISKNIDGPWSPVIEYLDRENGVNDSEQKSYFGNNTQDEKVKVGGWLLFFGLSLTAFGPLYRVVTLIYSLGNNDFKKIPDIFQNLYYLEYITIFGLSAYGFIIGVKILKNNPFGARLARDYLQYSFTIFLLVEFVLFLIGYASSIGDSTVIAKLFGASFGSTAQATAYFLIWWYYFKKSKRVKRTYTADSLKPEKLASVTKYVFFISIAFYIIGTVSLGFLGSKDFDKILKRSLAGVFVTFFWLTVFGGARSISRKIEASLKKKKTPTEKTESVNCPHCDAEVEIVIGAYDEVYECGSCGEDFTRIQTE